MMLTFTFTVNIGDDGVIREVAFAGNMDIQVAPQLLQQVVVAELVRRNSGTKEADSQTEEKEKASKE